MKAIILERRGEYAAALREDGVVIKTRIPGEVGETIELESKVMRFQRGQREFRRFAVAAAVAVVILGGTYTYLAVPACAYISLDVGDSSVELSVNRLGRVVGVTPVNGGSEEFAKRLRDEAGGRRVEEAMDRAVTLLRSDGYLGGTDDVVIVGVTADTQARGEAFINAAEQAVTASGGEDVQLYTVEVTEAERQSARAQEISGGRLLFEQMAEQGIFPPPEREPENRTPIESAVPTETPQPTATPQPTPLPTQTPTNSPAPATPRPTAQPVETQPPAPTNQPVGDTPRPTAQPVNTQPPAPTNQPGGDTPRPTAQPVDTQPPAPTNQPGGDTPRPTAQPVETQPPAPTNQPGGDTPRPTAQPVETQPPAPTNQPVGDTPRPTAQPVETQPPAPTNQPGGDTPRANTQPDGPASGNPGGGDAPSRGGGQDSGPGGGPGR